MSFQEKSTIAVGSYVLAVGVFAGLVLAMALLRARNGAAESSESR